MVQRAAKVKYDVLKVR